MNYYEPSQYLSRFVYKASDNSVSIVSRVNVFLPAGESLISEEPVYVTEQDVTSRNYNSNINQREKADYDYIHESMVKIAVDNIPAYTPNDKPGFISALRNVLDDKYEVLVKVIRQDRTLGGQVATTITKQENVEILD